MSVSFSFVDVTERSYDDFAKGRIFNALGSLYSIITRTRTYWLIFSLFILLIYSSTPLYISTSLRFAIFIFLYLFQGLVVVHSNQLFSYSFAVSFRALVWNWEYCALFLILLLWRCIMVHAMRADNPSPRTLDKTSRPSTLHLRSLRRRDEAYNINSTSAPHESISFSKLYISIL